MSDKNEKVIKIPITRSQRKINEMGEGYVPCAVSSRWLQFPESVSDSRFIPVDVMTMGGNDEEKKICELFLDRNDIVRAVNAIIVKD